MALDFNAIMLKFSAVLVIFILAFIFSRILGKLVYKVLNETDLNDILKRNGVNIDAVRKLRLLVVVVVYFVAVVFALRQLEVTAEVFKWLLIGVLGIALVFVLLFLRDLIPNLFAKVRMNGKKGLQVGNYVRMGDIRGNIIRIGATEIQIETKKGEKFFVPNSLAGKIVRLKK